MPRTKGKGTGQATKRQANTSRDGTKEYTVIYNLTDRVIVLSHPDFIPGDVRDVIIGVKSHAVVDGDLWNPDRVPFLRTLVERGDVEIVKTSQRPSIPDLSGVPMPSRLMDQVAVRHIVFTDDDESAMEYINMEPIQENVAGNPVDIRFLRERQKPILIAALEMMKRLNRPEHKARIEAIEKRIEEIDKMPAG